MRHIDAARPDNLDERQTTRLSRFSWLSAPVAGRICAECAASANGETAAHSAKQATAGCHLTVGGKLSPFGSELYNRIIIARESHSIIRTSIPMKTFSCQCGNMLFFENTRCVACGCHVGWCPACRNITALNVEANGKLRCGNTQCGSPLVKCLNYVDHDVCNRCLVPGASGRLCDYCRFNDTIPDLAAGDNREKWYRLEVAKRRLLYSLDQLRLPYGNEADGIDPPLSFDFKADAIQKGKWWWPMGKLERVYTGHAGGKITINIAEADTVEREKARTAFQEAHRTVIGHFRHEMAHYYWQMLVQGECEIEFKQAFGDHENPTYSDALERFYSGGTPIDWRRNFVSAYATMHPWEDFAETFATYLDMVSVLDTAFHGGFGNVDPTTADLDQIVSRYRNLGLVMNEMNRAMGLMDLVPEVFTQPVVEKLRFVHELIRRAAKPAVR